MGWDTETASPASHFLSTVRHPRHVHVADACLRGQAGSDVEAERLGLPVHLIGGFDYDEAESRDSALRWQPDFTRRGNFQPGDKYRRLSLENLGQDGAPKLTVSDKGLLLALSARLARLGQY